MHDEGSGRLTIRRSKTDQDGQGAVLYIGSPTVRRSRAWLKAEGAPTDGPRMRRGGTITDGCLSCVSLRKIIRRRAEAIGLTGRITGHSLRVGSALDLVRGGASLPETQQAGRWQSARMPAHYTRGEIAGRGAVARIRYSPGLMAPINRRG